MSTLYPFLYPLGEPDLQPTSVYEIPTSCVMAYSRGNPYEDSFYIPTRFVPGATEGHSMSFTAPHNGMDGFYPAFKICSYVHVTDYTGHTFNNVTKETVSLMVTATEITVGYKDLQTGSTIILGPLPLVDEALITEQASDPTPSVVVKRTIQRRYTLAPNNLPSSISSSTPIIESGDTIGVYLPPKDTVFSFANISIHNPYGEPIKVGVFYTSATGSSAFYYDIPSGDSLKLDNKVVLYGEELNIVNLSSYPMSAYAGFAHMRNS